MSKAVNSTYDGPVGSGIVLSRPEPNLLFKSYVADRPGQNSRLRAAEIVLDVSITLAHAVQRVWPIFADFNLWMNRFGYVWASVPVNNEDNFAYLGSEASVNDPQADANGTRSKYIVRTVIPEKLIYFDSLPLRITGKDGVWTGHNLMSLHEEGGKTRIAVFMEHTWYSETMSIEELRAEAKGALDSGLDFWRDFFIPDLIAALDSKR